MFAFTCGLCVTVFACFTYLDTYLLAIRPFFYHPCASSRASSWGRPPMALPPGEQATASGVPVVALQQFLAALRARDFVGAKRLAFQSESLHLEPCPRCES